MTVKELKPTPEVKIDAELLLTGEVQTIRDNEFISYKPRWGAFYNTTFPPLPPGSFPS